jgi:hypothetical protein
MTTDDRDTESQNPSKSFKVGEVDRLSGFFTPVWESKRRLRAQSPVPASSAAASSPSSVRGSDKNSRPSTPPPSGAPSGRTGEGQPVVNAPAAAKADPVHPGRTSRPPPRPSAAQRAAATSKGVTTKAEPTPSDVAGPAVAKPPVEVPAAPTPIGSAAPVERDEGVAAAPGSVDSAAPGMLTARGDDLAPVSRPTDAEARGVNTPAVAPDALAGTTLTTGVAVSVRPVIPMPSTPGRAAARPSKPPSSPRAAPVALKQTSPNPDPGDGLERDPESRESEAAPLLLRRPARAEKQRPTRAGNAGGASYERLERKPPTDSVDTFPRYRETESEREALQAMAARAAATAADPYPNHVLRTLRRTIHLSTTLPEAVRQMVDKYRY